MAEDRLKIIDGEEAQRVYNELKGKGLILFECIVGSQAYGTALPTSDIDKKFIFIDTHERILSSTQVHQINLTKDYVGYEVGRFIELLRKGNPNMLDLVATPEDCIITCHPLYKKYFIDNQEKFITKSAHESFGKYAASQIQKARGLNKKIMNPMDEVRKGLSDFCWVAKEEGGSISLKEYIEDDSWLSEIPYEFFGIAAIDHMKNSYQLYVSPAYNEMSRALRIHFANGGNMFTDEEIEKGWEDARAKNTYGGIFSKDDVQLILTSTEKDTKPVLSFYCNIEGFQKYCNEYREYWHWVKNRNEERYQNNQAHGADYDSKNMAHCHRLLDMCIELFKDKKINVRRENREQLLEIRAGKYPYEQLLEDANSKIATINELVITSDLPESVDHNWCVELIVSIRKAFYMLNRTTGKFYNL